MKKIETAGKNYSWFALADAEKCRLLRCKLTKQGTQHVDELGAIANTLPEQEHARPMTDGGTTHHAEEKERRFAGEIVTWLQQKTKEYKVDRLAILAPARMLGVLRKTTSGLLTGFLQELKGDLMRLETGQLAEHPMVLELAYAVKKH